MSRAAPSTDGPEGPALPPRRRGPRPIAPALAAVLAAALWIGACGPVPPVPSGGAAAQAAPARAGGELPRKSALGVRMAPLPEEIQAREGLAAAQGVLVEAVTRGSAAEEAGIQGGDVLLAMDARPVAGIGDVIERVGTVPVGETVELTLLRAGRRMTVRATMRERPRDRGDGWDVLYRHVVSRGVRLRTIVTRPHAAGRHPALLLVQGLGVTPVDQPLDAPGAYSRILREFARRGYVTVRVDKPGIGDSEGGPDGDTDFDTELDAYRQALAAARADAFVDPDEVFVFGHSMGGVVAPILASETEVKGVAVYGTVVKTWTEYFLENWRRQAVLAGDDPAAIDGLLRGLAVALHEALAGATRDEIARRHPELRPVLGRLMPGGRIDGRPVRFWAQVATRNLPAYWAQGHAHVLAIWGRHDFIATEADHPLIAAIVNRARPGKGAAVVLERSDHGLRLTTSVQDSFRRWKSPGGELDPAIVTTLTEWADGVRAGS